MQRTLPDEGNVSPLPLPAAWRIIAGHHEFIRSIFLLYATPSREPSMREKARMWQGDTQILYLRNVAGILS